MLEVNGIPGWQALQSVGDQDLTKLVVSACEALAVMLQEHCKQKLAPYKYPRWIEFRKDLPKTATGKIQRFKLRAEGPGAL